MICLALGLGVLGFCAMRKARRCHMHGGCGGGGWRGGYWGHRHGHHGHHRSWMLHAALARIDASPAQERAIIHEVEKLRERLRGARGGLRDGRADLAAAIRGSSLDDAALGAVLGRVDGATGEARTAVLEALRNIHALLDDRQRGLLADMLDSAGWRGGGGPYRM